MPNGRRKKGKIFRGIPRTESANYFPSSPLKSVATRTFKLKLVDYIAKEKGF